MDTFIELLVEWGIPGMFVSAFLAGSVIPFSSELVLVALVKLGVDPTACLISATLGNTLGGMTCYWMGHLGRIDWLEKYFKIKKEKIDKMQVRLQGRGAMCAFFAFLPIAGSVLSVALGFMRSNIWITAISMMVGKCFRYAMILWALGSAIDAVL